MSISHYLMGLPKEDYKKLFKKMKIKKSTNPYNRGKKKFKREKI